MDHADLDCWQLQWEVSQAREIWTRYLKRERKLIERRRRILTILWKSAIRVKILWGGIHKLSTAKYRKSLATVIRKFGDVKSLDRRDYKILYKGIHLAKKLLNKKSAAEEEFFKNIQELLKNEKDLYHMALEPSRQLKVFRRAVTSLFAHLQWW